MTYSIQKLSNERWGIYLQDRLLATHGCQQTFLLVLELLQKKNKTGFISYKHLAWKNKNLFNKTNLIMNIEILIGLDDCLLAIYRRGEDDYYFSVVNVLGQIYTCNSSFPTISSAKLMGTSAIKRLAIERDY